MHAPWDRITLTRSTPSRGSRIHRALLIGLGSAAVFLGLYAAHGRTRLGEQLAGHQRTWSDRLARYERLGNLALATSVPANEVFDSDDLDAETARSERARLEFVAVMDSARLDLTRAGADSAIAPVLADLADIETATEALIVDVDRTFASYGVGPPPEVEVINGHLNRINDGVELLAGHAREAQSRGTKRLLDRATLSQSVAAGILAVIFLLAFGTLRAARRRAASEDFVATGTAPADRDAAAPAGDEAHGGMARGAPREEISRLPGWLDPALHAGVCLLALVLGLHAAFSLGMLGSRLMEQDRSWSERLARYDRMSRIALGISAPGDEVFDSGDLEAETARSRQARAELGAELDSARRDVTRSRSRTSSAPLLERLYAVRRAADDLATDVDRTFTGYELGQPPEAAVVNRSLARVGNELDALAHAAREVRVLESGRLLNAAAAPQWVGAWLVALLWLGAIAAPAIARRRWRPAPASAPEVERAIETAPAFAYTADVPALASAVEAPVVTTTAGVPALAYTADAPALVSAANLPSLAVAADAPRLAAVADRPVLASAADAPLPAAAVVEPSPLPRPGPFAKLLPLLPPLPPVAAAGPLAALPPQANRATNGVIVTDAEGRIEWVNEAFGRISGHKPEDLQGCKLDALLHDSATPREPAERVAAKLAAGAPLPDVLADLVGLVEERQPGSVCMVLVRQPGMAHLRVAASPSLSDDFLRAAEEVEIGPKAATWGTAAYTGKRVIVGDTSTHPVWAGFRRLALHHGLRSSWAEPVLSATGQVAGVLAVFRRRVHIPDDFELQLVASAARVAAVAIERAPGLDALWGFRGDEPARRAA